MSLDQWLLLLGALLLVIALAHPVVKRLPITTPIIYLGVGVAISPFGLGAIDFDPLAKGRWIHYAAEFAVLISLFTVGMKLRLPLRDRKLRPALCLAFISMVITTALVAAAGVWLLTLPLGSAILLGAVLAPTDPVLASDVQIQHPQDTDKIRLTLSAEAGLNDGTAFPMVMLGLGLMGLHDLGQYGIRWILTDLVWATVGGVVIGAALGYGVGRLAMSLHTQRGDKTMFGEYLVLGLIGVAYGIAIVCKTYGFLAVFAAGVALRAAERHASERRAAIQGRGDAAQPDQPTEDKGHPGYLAGALLATNEQIEHILEVGLVLLVGASLFSVGFAWEVLWFAPLLFLIIRPLATLPIFLVQRFSRFEFAAVSWFGIRGIGSLYYVMFAVSHGLPDEIAQRLLSLTLTTIAVSIVVHGVSVTPFFAMRSR